MSVLTLELFYEMRAKLPIKKIKLDRNGKSWTVVEEKKLIVLYNNGLSYNQIAEELETRSKSAIGARLVIIRKRDPSLLIDRS